MIKSKIVRLFPNKEQEQLLWRHIGASRFIYNYMLALQIEQHKKGEKHLSAYNMTNLLPKIKRAEEFAWLNDIGSHTLQRSCADLATAYERFFHKQSGFPKFKSRKKSKMAFPVDNNLGALWFSPAFVQIPKISKMPYRAQENLPLGRQQKFFNPRISYTPNDKWILTFGVECENQTPTLTDLSMGIDLGIKELAVVAYGDEQIAFHNKNKSKKMRQLNRKLAHYQRNLARKYSVNGSYEETSNVRKTKKKIKRLYYHISNIRKDYLHKTTHELISKCPKRVVMETLSVQDMMKNKHLAKYIQEQCFYEFKRQMKYKCEWNGIEFVEVERYYPSSKTCSCCGAIKKDLKLNDRIYHCGACGLTIDRDYNAAVNLMGYGVQGQEFYIYGAFGGASNAVEH